MGKDGTSLMALLDGSMSVGKDATSLGCGRRAAWGGTGSSKQTILDVVRGAGGAGSK